VRSSAERRRAKPTPVEFGEDRCRAGRAPVGVNQLAADQLANRLRN
jgi:hypothetical protein